MKKVMLLLIAVAIIFSACSRKDSSSRKSSKIEIFSAEENTLLATVVDKKEVEKFNLTDDWEEKDELPKDLIPEYKLVVYQEKTLLAGEDPDEQREYEIIERITTYKDSSYVKVAVSPDMVKNIKLSDEILTFYYVIPDEIINDLKQLL